VTLTFFPTAQDLTRAASLLRDCQLVAFPTETVYGLGGDARSDIAVARIFAAKNRPTFNPLIIHVPDLATAQTYAQFSPLALDLAARFWPGPLTLVLPLIGGRLSALATAGLRTVAIRIPAHPTAQALLHAAGIPLAAPSANPSGKISPTTAAHVAAGLTGRIAAILDGGPCAVGLESTILALDPHPTLLRPGGLPTELIDPHTGPLAAPGPQVTSTHVTSPGQLASHYAPNAPLRLNATQAQPGETLIGFGPIPGDLTLSAEGDLTEAAANLFATLRTADGLAGPDGRIAIAPIPHQDLGRAINDRLNRAAAPRRPPLIPFICS
jgi:L-threonylcarbamoyladenylate synthase